MDVSPIRTGSLRCPNRLETFCVTAHRVASIRPDTSFERLWKGEIAMKLARIVALSFTLLALAACGGDDGGSTTSPGQTSPPASGSTLVLKDNVFEPTEFTIQSGTRITLKNEGAALHNLTVEGQDFN